MITIDILNEINTVRLYKFNQIPLQMQMILGKFNGFLDNSTSIAILRELKDVVFDHLKESMFMSFLSILKELLEHIISKLVLSQFDAFLNE